MRRRLLRAGLAVAAFSMAMAVPAAAHGTDSDVDTTSLPVGQTSDEPTVGSYWPCQSFQSGQGGAGSEGDWFNGDGTWDATKKTTVDGSVTWENAKFTREKQNGKITFTTNDLPVDHTTGEFPISPDDDAYENDRNPNSIQTQNLSFSIDATPELADEASCAGGEVGILKSGVILFSPTDAGGRDAVAYEVQDSCDGHPQVSGLYHYHSASDCVLEELDSGTGQSKQIGWAFDGFGIFGPRDENGKELTSADLDECHGTTSRVKFNGKWQTIYHYVATVDYPYVVGCFRGTSTVQAGLGGGGGQGQPGGTQNATQDGQAPGNMPPPPPGAGDPPPTRSNNA